MREERGGWDGGGGSCERREMEEGGWGEGRREAGAGGEGDSVPDRQQRRKRGRAVGLGRSWGN